MIFTLHGEIFSFPYENQYTTQDCFRKEGIFQMPQDLATMQFPINKNAYFTISILFLKNFVKFSKNIFPNAEKYGIIFTLSG